MTPRKGTRGTYHAFNRDGSVNPDVKDRFTVHRIDGNLCYSVYDSHCDKTPTAFIWRFHDGLNKLHTWPGKTA